MKLKLIKTFIACLLLIPAGGSYYKLYSSSRDLKGYVIDAESSDPLPNVFVKIIELGKNTYTNSDGYFEFKGLGAGEYNLEFGIAGYKNHNLKITVTSDTLQSLLVKMISMDFRTPVITISDEHPKSKFDRFLELSNVLKDKELQRNLGQTLAATLKNETGLSMRSMGPAPSRPVFRGLSGDRVLITEDGMKSYDLSSTSPDHSVTVEPFTVERIEVIRGTKVLLKTPATIGGVINVVRYEIPQFVPSEITLKLGGFGETSNNGFLGSAVAEIPYKKFVLRGEGSYRKTADLSTPGGTLKNSDIETRNYSIGSSFVDKWGYTGISFREYQTDYGIPGGFVGSHPNGVDISMLKRQYNFKLNYDIESKMFDHIDLEASRVYYKHTEFESSGVIGAEFRIVNYSGFLNLYHKKTGFLKNGVIGSSFEKRDFTIGGFVFTPPSNSFSIAGYINEEFETGKKWNIELSARYNYDKIEPVQIVQLANLDTVYRREFSTFSISISAIYELDNKLNIGLNLSRSSRVPTIEELYSDGPHLAAYSYEIGNPALNDEKGFGSEMFCYYKNDNYFAMIAGFFNDLSSYIIPRNTGRINFATLLPIYQTEGVGARIYGLESQIEIEPFKFVSLNASLSYTRGEIKETKSPLPQIPPLKSIIEVRYSDQKFTAGINSELALQQKRVDEFEEPTAGYLIFGAFAQYSLMTGKVLHNVSVNVDNLTNQTYWNHLSRIKSIMPEPGTNLRLTYKLYY